ncbi:hypothetical protein [Corynebacterium caspium]|uniref:hypothetical protein n=1 Tax=Corynebacterium caspium TaxID=234828 RepID=UPI00036355A4|nr:hypothetical protein [Corynebacterium caspium]WKD58698.1 Rossmann-like domain protein [Corynebacterium caspium DSM 44850]
MAAPQLKVLILEGEEASADITTQIQSVQKNMGVIGKHQVSKAVLNDTTLPLIKHHDLLFLAAVDAELPNMVAKLNGQLHPGQIVAHGSLTESLQILDDLEVTGAIAMVLAPVTSELWAVETYDETGAAVADMLVTEMQGRSTQMGLEHRLELSARISALKVLEALTFEFQENIGELMPSGSVAGEEGYAWARNIPDDATLSRQLEVLAKREDPKYAQLIASLKDHAGSVFR